MRKFWSSVGIISIAVVRNLSVFSLFLIRGLHSFTGLVLSEWTRKVDEQNFFLSLFDINYPILFFIFTHIYRKIKCIIYVYWDIYLCYLI